MNNTSFSTTSCYAVLSSCTNKDPLHAFLELVNALIDEKKYTNLDPQVMSDDFEKKFGISLPYHPMQAIIQLGIDEKYFEYNSSLKVVYPIWSAIDARSVFMTLHFNNGYIAHTLPDVKNIFITTNKTLARVGKILTSEIAHNLGNYIPIALSDLTWGTLVWANSPAKISSLNKSNIISAAYAAFQPSEEVLRRLNKTLIKCQESGEISPEKCYFLKTNSVALRMLSQKTQNDENRYSDQMPFEILKELRKEGFEEGLLEKQKEVDQLAKEKEAANFELSLAKQVNIIEGLKKDKLAVETLLTDWQQRKKLLEQYIARLETTKCSADRKIKRRLGGFKFLAVAICIIYVYVVFKIAKSTEFNWLVDAIGGSVPAILAALYFWRKYRVSPAKITEILEAKITNKVYLEYSFVPDEYEKLKNEHIDAVEQISALQGQLTQLSAELKRENAKIDSYSVDISLIDR